ncbi:predicted protein [Uncinocarpus reesii 1704]|uniref:Calcineurin-like phosphoesterase domain-containing protein n=1 Tax=Uncinocarpus reesii (strain UAMH 1704) TaxID=336963 RepID=C4JUQ5_UNCRE|nr:uncharacterized protein UREG_04858 [Uncinocarpus reesii 1704]EEP80016.1 predicted protein [Uncinocarpus reesii 1704]
MAISSSVAGLRISAPIPAGTPLKRPISRWDQWITNQAARLYRWHTSGAVHYRSLASLRPIKVVCISDTHSAEPELPDGDILLHAGDLSERGTFDQIQAQLDWLNRQPHRYKVVIAGNHDILLDPAFVDRFPERIVEGPGSSREDLKWGDIIYLNDNSITLTFYKEADAFSSREVKIYGSPWTHQFGNWAFQVPPIRDIWTDSVPEDVDILLMHGPPKYHLDAHALGNIFLNRELCRVKPRLAVFGHIHAGYGEKTVVFDEVELLYAELRDGKWKGCVLVKMIWRVLAARLAMSELLNFILSNDEAFKRRLGSLYSDFPLQRDPDGYAINIAAWQKAFANATLAGLIPTPARGAKHDGIHAAKSHHHNRLVLSTSNALSAALETREWGRPLALQAVIDESLRTGNMIALPEFLNSPTSPFKKSWVRLPPAPSLSQILGWGMKQARGFIIGADYDHPETSRSLQSQDLVLVDNLKEVEKRLMRETLAHHHSVVDRIYSKKLFRVQFGHVLGGNTELSPTDLDVLLTFLSRDQNSILYDGETIKFKDAGDSSVSITQEDKTIASLKTLIFDITAQVSSLDAKIRDLTLNAQNALGNKNRILALSALRSKKLAERNMKQRLDTLYQLEEVYAKIEQAVDQVDIIRIMGASTGVLRGLNEQVGDIETVEDVVEELRKEMANVDEVGNIISETAPSLNRRRGQRSRRCSPPQRYHLLLSRTPN